MAYTPTPVTARLLREIAQRRKVEGPRLKYYPSWAYHVPPELLEIATREPE